MYATSEKVASNRVKNIEENSEDIIIDLANHFNDAENGANLQYTIYESIASLETSVNGTQLILSVSSGNAEEGFVTILASDNIDRAVASLTFSISIVDVNEPPVANDIYITGDEDEDVTFELSTQQLDRLLKAAAIYQLPDLSVIGENGVVKVLVRDKKNDTSNDYSVIVGETESVFSFNFKVENIKILPGTYEVVCSQKNLSRFTNKNQDLVYFIALEPDSTFG